MTPSILAWVALIGGIVALLLVDLPAFALVGLRSMYFLLASASSTSTGASRRS